MRMPFTKCWIISRTLVILLLVLVPLLGKFSVAVAQNIPTNEGVFDNGTSDKSKNEKKALDESGAAVTAGTAGVANASGAADSSEPKAPVKQPLQGYAKQDSMGTPAIPEWKLKSGYDEVLGTFYVGLFGFKMHAMNGPMGEAVLGKSKLEHWKGHKPHPCLLKFTKMTDDSGGYYFKTMSSEDGPRGWILPQPLEPHKPRAWAIYFMQ
jgi:hypothetical protein